MQLFFLGYQNLCKEFINNITQFELTHVGPTGIFDNRCKGLPLRYDKWGFCSNLRKDQRMPNICEGRARRMVVLRIQRALVLGQRFQQKSEAQWFCI